MGGVGRSVGGWVDVQAVRIINFGTRAHRVGVFSSLLQFAWIGMSMNLPVR